MTTTTPTRSREPAEPVHNEPSDRTATQRKAGLTLLAAAGLVLLHLTIRAWVVMTSWFTGDDFMFVSRMVNGGTPPSEAIQPQSGHIMPAGLYLSWLANRIGPYDWTVNATMLLVMQAVASVGLVVLLVRLFGARPGILPPLALYLFCSTAIATSVWWAVAVNAVPLQATLFWALVPLVDHLRTRSTRSLVLALVIVVVGLLFMEKAILVLVAFVWLALAYFTTGPPSSRLLQVWQSYRRGVLVFGGLGLVYVGFYTAFALGFSPRGPTSDAFGETASNLVLQTYIPSLVGGPWHWTAADPTVLPDPGSVGMLIALVAVGWVLRELHLGLSGTLRAWFLPGFFLVAAVLLVLAGRVWIVGAQIALDPRYQGELPAVTAIALACASMRIKGAKEGPAPRAGATPRLPTQPPRVAGLTAAFVVLGSFSSLQYSAHWNDDLRGKDYVQRLDRDLGKADGPVPFVDHSVPIYLVWALSYPLNTLSHIFAPYADRMDYPEVATDKLNMVDSHGRVQPMVVTPTRTGVRGPEEGCGYAVGESVVSIPLDGPVSYDGFWVRIGYLSSGKSPVVVKAGAASYSAVVKAGVHALYFESAPSFDAVEISALASGVHLCTDDVTVGNPRPLSEMKVPSP